MNNYGFQPSKIQPSDYRLGGAVQLKGQVLVPDGQWDNWLPVKENQSVDGFEPYACVSFAVLHAVEALIKQSFGEVEIMSPRFLAYATGTEAMKGNDPTTVCRFLGQKGDVPETDWPYPTPATDFYKTPPQPLYTLALEFPAEFQYDNQWVPATSAAMKDALTRSPLTVAGYAWAQDTEAMPMYYTPDGAQPCHYFVIYGYEDGVAWHAFDTYENNYKRLRWDYQFTQVKEHALHRNVVKPSAFALFVQWLRTALGLQGPSFGAARSSEWPRVRAAHIAKEPCCQVCGGTTKLNVHHIRPFHLHPELELDDTNLITLCNGSNGTIACHIRLGHWDNFRTKYNIHIREEAPKWRARFEAKTMDESL